MVGSELQSLQLGDPLLDEYLAFVGARARRNTWLAVAFDLKVFFSVVGKPPAEVRTPDVMSFLTSQRRPRHGSAVVRLADGESGLAARTIARRMSSVRSLFDYLLVRGDTSLRTNPVPHGLAIRQPGSRGRRSVPRDCTWSSIRAVRRAETYPAGWDATTRADVVHRARVRHCRCNDHRQRKARHVGARIGFHID